MTSAPPQPPGAGAAIPAAERRRGYGRWTGVRSAQAWRWWVIARGNMAVAFANKWMKGLLVGSLVPGIMIAGIAYLVTPLSAAMLQGMMGVQLVFAFLVATLAGARLVSEDRRQGAFLAHFSRPVRPVDYVAGKYVALLLPLLLVTAGGAMLPVFSEGVLDGETAVERAARESGQPLELALGVDPLTRPMDASDGFWAVIGWSIAVSATTSGIVLGVSALVTRARLAGVIWFGIVAFGSAAQGILQGALRKDWPALLSWTDNLSDVGARLLGLRSNSQLGLELEYSAAARILVLATAAAVGIGVVFFQMRRAEGGVK